MSWWNFFDPSYPDLQFKILGYQYPPYRRVQQKHGRGEIVFLKEGLVARRLRDFEWDTSDSITVQKMKFSIMDFFSKFNQIRSFQRSWSHLLKKFLMENFIFVQCICLKLTVYLRRSDLLCLLKDLLSTIINNKDIFFNEFSTLKSSKLCRNEIR